MPLAACASLCRQTHGKQHQQDRAKSAVANLAAIARQTAPTWQPAPRGQLGSGPRYQILSHVFACCASQKTHGHARIARVSRVQFLHVRVFSDSHNVQKSVTQIISLGPLPTSEIQNIQTFHPLFLESVPKAFKVTAIVSKV